MVIQCIYTKEDFSKFFNQFDIVFDAVGKANKSLCKRMLVPKGKFVTVNNLWNKGKAELSEIKDLIEKGEELKTIIDKEYTLNQIVEAHIYVDQSHKKGNVVINVSKSIS